ncbi:hypothetical protein [Limoniibacter endophyticus]|uniref:Uncharacterized protein n=1 Tax=Limoniibacter endophyticus TaxID=1565040 RepID=A0A8J3DLW2_9HYPH|nr:hypothetical protein [Limoniibacter endophyticus]GHC68961.1 hypothetical protein GCM10010136_14210 [Limoniibacter endophyticus]
MKRLSLSLLSATALTVMLTAGSAHALSEMKPGQQPVKQDERIEKQDLPPPAAAQPKQDDEQAAPEPNDDEEAIEDQATEGGGGVPGTETVQLIGEVSKDIESLPTPVKNMRRLILEAAESANFEALRPLIGTGENATQIPRGTEEEERDPIDMLKQLVGDEGGFEMLAIIQNLLNTGYVHVEPGTPQELYVWPYFVSLPVENLDSKQKVELFRIVTGGDYEEMKQAGAYNFFSIGISPQGKWVFLNLGD